VTGKTYRDLGGPISNGKGAHEARGTHHSSAKLNESRVLEIRAAAAGGETVRSLAAKHGVCTRSISKVVIWVTWKHVGDALRDVARSSGRRSGGTVAGRQPVEAAVESGAGLGTLARVAERV